MSTSAYHKTKGKTMDKFNLILTIILKLLIIFYLVIILAYAVDALETRKEYLRNIQQLSRNI